MVNLFSSSDSGDDETQFTQLKPKDPVTPALPENNGSSTRSLILLAVIFLSAVLLLGTVYYNFPKLGS